MATKKLFNDGNFGNKVLAMLKYDSELLIKVHSGKNKELIQSGAAKLLLKYFEYYIDSRARSNPSMLHHVYEFDMTGDPDGRLFKGQVSNTNLLSTISFSFTQTKKPNREGYMFYNKAEIMESGQSVVIVPKRSKFLTYKLKDGKFIKSEKSIVENPGGAEVKGSFRQEFDNFISMQAEQVLSEFKYYEKVNDNIRMKRSRVIPSINNMSLSNYASRAAIDATEIALGAYNTSDIGLY